MGKRKTFTYAAFRVSSTEHRYIELFLNSTSSGAAELSEFLLVIRSCEVVAGLNKCP